MSTPTAAQVLAYQASQIGTGESPAGSNHNKYTEWYGSNDAWCFMFQSYAFNHFGALSLIHGKHAYVPDFKSIFSAHGEFHWSNPSAGDLVAFDFNASGEPEHIGIVEKVLSASTIQTIEGNTSDEVLRRVRNRRYAWAYATPKYAKPNPGGWPGRYLLYNRTSVMHGSDVTWAQKRLGAHHRAVSVDGWYGPKTSMAVKAFQQDVKLPVDGVVGPKTWAALAK